MGEMPDTVISALARSLTTLQAKYATTFSQLETEIEETEAELAAMMDELVAGEADRKGLDELRKLLGR